MLVEWREELATGNPTIDSQHKELFRRLEGLSKACQEGKGRQELHGLLQFLREYVVRHFADEERLQLEYGYPDYRHHKAQHDGFVAEIAALDSQLASEGTTLPLMVLTNSVVFNWLGNHIIRMDSKLADFVRKSETADEVTPSRN
ncbi:bacteriohemerythrin [Geobacter sp. DSM 9736]|uniref:bacteriohemerythrin n=1 Tax=Geobacter sp. DSM 9736 TaxID=1277350 RepID=UPI000B512BD9|nr:bacteriohemerythrin [Geobacter sp. DSM 9736]SNB46820.1 hemerythrin [Geobacter sp. DSM 9736]